MSADRTDNWNPCINSEPHEAHEWRFGLAPMGFWHCPGVLAQWEQELVRTTSDMADQLAKAAERRGYEKAVATVGDLSRYVVWMQDMSQERWRSLAFDEEGQPKPYCTPAVAAAFLADLAEEVLGG